MTASHSADAELRDGTADDSPDMISCERRRCNSDQWCLHSNPFFLLLIVLLYHTKIRKSRQKCSSLPGNYKTFHISGRFFVDVEVRIRYNRIIPKVDYLTKITKHAGDFRMKRDRIAAALLSAVLCLTPAVSGSGIQTAFAAEGVSAGGDIDRSGTPDYNDAAMLQRWLLAEQEVWLPDWTAGDLDGNGKLDAADLTLLKRLLMNPPPEAGGADIDEPQTDGALIPSSVAQFGTATPSTGDVIRFGASNFAAYDSSGNQTVDTGYSIEIGALSGGRYTVTVSR